MYVCSSQTHKDIPAYRILTTFYELLDFLNSAAEVPLILYITIVMYYTLVSFKY
jgi:hypothetical protein